MGAPACPSCPPRTNLTVRVVNPTAVGECATAFRCLPAASRCLSLRFHSADHRVFSAVRPLTKPAPPAPAVGPIEVTLAGVWSKPPTRDTRCSHPLDAVPHYSRPGPRRLRDHRGPRPRAYHGREPHRPEPPRPTGAGARATAFPCTSAAVLPKTSAFRCTSASDLPKTLLAVLLPFCQRLMHLLAAATVLPKTYVFACTSAAVLPSNLL